MLRFALVLAVILPVVALPFNKQQACAEAPAVTGMFPLGAQQGTTADIAAEGKLPVGTRISTTAGIKFTMPEKGNTVKVEVGKEVPPGTHWLRFHNSDGAGEPVPFVVGQLVEVTEVEPNNLTSKSTKVPTACVVNGKLGQSGDVDVFSVPLKKGQTVVASVAANWKLGSQVDMVMQLVSPRGAVLEQNDDDHGNDPLISATVPSDGEWHVRVFGFPSKPNSTIAFAGNSTYRYRLTISTQSFVNHAIPSVIAEAGKTDVQLSGWNLAEPLKSKVTLTGKSARLEHQSLSNVVPLSVFKGPVFAGLEPCDKSKPVAVTVPCAISGVIDIPGDEDVFRFTAKKSDKLVFRVESRSLGMPLDPTVTLYDATGKKITENDDSARNVFDAKLAYTIRADGDYLIGIRDLFRNGGWRFHYRLFVEQPAPTVSLTSATNSFVLLSDKPLELPITVGRLNGFKEELMIELAGLPKGVTCQPVKSEVKGATAKTIKLIVKNTDSKAATAFSGPIRVITKIANKTQVEATATLATYNNYKTSDLWLTRKAAAPKPTKEPAKTPAKK